jgi:hypothetical protein
VNSHTRSASAVSARTPSVSDKGVGWVAAISVGEAMRGKRAFWMKAEDEMERFVS